MPLKKIKDLIIGGKKKINKSTFHTISLIALFAWVGLGADGLTSSCYGPEEAFKSLGTHYHLGVFVALLTGLTIVIVSMSYTQLIEVFPSGGGGYLVASKLLSPTIGMVSGCALIVDYILTIALSISSGADALFSFLPMTLLKYKFWFVLFILLVLIIMNLRGVKESVTPLVPIFLVFVISHSFLILYAVFSNVFNIPHIAKDTIVETGSTISKFGVMGMVIIIMKAYSMGAGTFTGIEAVSNGMSVLREPRIKTGKKTMRYMMLSLALMVMGIMLSYVIFQVKPMEGKTLNAIVFENVLSGLDKNTALVIIMITLLSEAILLFVAAQTGFLGGPQVIANMAKDRWLPTRFSVLSDRLVTQNGVIFMGIAAGLLIIFTKASVQYLVVLYSINVFITFCLSQLGMVKYWIIQRKTEKNWIKKIIINSIGLFLCLFILLAIVIIKFGEGGWVTIIITGFLISISLFIKSKYNKTAMLVKDLDKISDVIEMQLKELKKVKSVVPDYDLKAKTAVIFVSGFNGLGLHTLFNIIKYFGGIYKNFVFVEIGVIDYSNFKGMDEIGRLKKKISSDLEKYVLYMNKNNYYAEKIFSVGTDIVDEVESVIPKIIKKHPNSVFFAGKLVLKDDYNFSNFLHNNVVFELQKKIYLKGYPFVMMPAKI